ncbi:FHA domain-containing protein [Gymnodinialimonas sp. 2305UL16-5]|uniref:FHA domain-containing protein n=1 Tax=Gymnodinialimonas mytili TaxID=3126503 RepID=UPI0030B64EAA
MRPLPGPEEPEADGAARNSEPRAIGTGQARHAVSDPRAPNHNRVVSRPRRQIWDLEADESGARPNPEIDAQTAAYAAAHQNSEPRPISHPQAPRRLSEGHYHDAPPASEPLVLRNPVAPPSQPRYATSPHPEDTQPRQPRQFGASYDRAPMARDHGYEDYGHPSAPPHHPGPSHVSGNPAKTRILGFHADAAQGDALDHAAHAQARLPRFPAGWLVVTDGPGLGAFFAVTTSVSAIGRGSDQDICLDFGDTSISRQNHAAVAYDLEQNRFFLGHGSKSNVVRRNNQPVLSTEELLDGDLIRIGKTTLRFVALCGADFTWPAEALEDAEGGHYG